MRKAKDSLTHIKVLMIDGDRSLRCVPHRHSQDKETEVAKMSAIGERVCSISHDMRHSLSAIYANAELLERPNIRAYEQADLLCEIQQAVVTMTELIDSLLQFANSGGKDPRVRKRISHVIENAINSVRRHPDGNCVSITQSTSSNAEATIDAKRLESAIYNLLINACQAAICATDVPKVNVDLEVVDNCIYITITDNGIGVPSSVRRTLFDPFVTSGKRNGTGLGLALARRIAEEHGGNVSLQGSVRGKTVFTLMLKSNKPQTNRGQLTCVADNEARIVSSKG